MEITLTRGKVALIDDADAHLAQWKWQYNDTKNSGNGYAIRSISSNGKTKRIYMHRAVMGVESNGLIRHLNGNHLDNRRENLEKVTHSQRAVYASNVRSFTGYRGVYPLNSKGKYCALITVNYKTKQIGTFDIAEEAARMYDIAAVECHGAYAVLNFPDSPPHIGLREALDEYRRTQARRLYAAGLRTTPYIGVNEQTPGRFRATIQRDGKQEFLGSYSTAEDAAYAHDKAARRYYGSEVFVNFP